MTPTKKNKWEHTIQDDDGKTYTIHYRRITAGQLATILNSDSRFAELVAEGTLFTSITNGDEEESATELPAHLTEQAVLGHPCFRGT